MKEGEVLGVIKIIEIYSMEEEAPKIDKVLNYDPGLDEFMPAAHE